MKKLFAKIAFLAMTAGVLFSGCKIFYNPPDNPWTNHEEGTEKWFEDLTTGDEKDAIKEYDVKDFIGCWQLMATTETSKEGEIISAKDWIVHSEVDRGLTQRFMQLFEDMTSAYSQYAGLYDGTPGLRTTELAERQIFFGFGMRCDEVGHGLGLGQIHFAVEESASCKLTCLRHSCAGIDEPLEKRLLDVQTAVTGYLDGIFACKRVRGTENGTKDLVKRLVVPLNAAEMNGIGLCVQ